MPSARAWNPGSSEPARLSSSTGSGRVAPGTAPSGRDAGSVSDDTSASSAAPISWSSRRVESCTARYALGVVDRVGVAVADEGSRPAQRLRHASRVTARAVGGSVDQCSSAIRAVLPATHSIRPTSLESATRSRRSARRRVGRPRELLAQARQLGRDGRLRLGIGHAACAGVGKPRHGRDGRGQPAPEVVVPRGRPDHQAGGDAEDAGQRPTHHAGTNGGRRLRPRTPGGRTSATPPSRRSPPGGRRCPRRARRTPPGPWPPPR